MSTDALNLFPARIPIGRVVLPDRSRADVLMTLEFSRALSDLFVRVGGANGPSNEDLAQMVLQAETSDASAGLRAEIGSVELRVPVDQSAQIAAMQQRIDELVLLGATVATLSAEVAALRQRGSDVEQMATYRDPFRIDWERPGKIGALTPNTGLFTSLSIGGLTVGTADIRTTNGATIVAGRLSNVGAGSQPGAFAVYAPNGSGTAIIWAQARVSVVTATAGAEACSLIFSTRVAGSFADVATLNSGGNLLVGTATDGMTASGSIAIAQDLAHRGSKLGFYNTAPVTKQTVTGSRGGNAALASLLTALATVGEITDSSTA